MSNRPRLAQLAPSGATNGQVARYNSTSGNWEPYTLSGAGLACKSGHILAASFSGTPKRATVTFVTPFPGGTVYNAPATAVTSNGKTFAIALETKTVNGFVINMGTNVITDLVQVDWIAMVEGESS